MSIEDFIKQLEELLEVEEGILSEKTQLENLAEWDSLAIISYIALVDENFDITIPPKKISEAETIGDLHKLILENAV